MIMEAVSSRGEGGWGKRRSMHGAKCRVTSSGGSPSSIFVTLHYVNLALPSCAVPDRKGYLRTLCRRIFSGEHTYQRGHRTRLQVRARLTMDHRRTSANKFRELLHKVVNQRLGNITTILKGLDNIITTRGKRARHFSQDTEGVLFHFWAPSLPPFEGTMYLGLDQ
jgi:hypothetical protein